MGSRKHGSPDSVKISTKRVTQISDISGASMEAPRRLAAKLAAPCFGILVAIEHRALNAETREAGSAPPYPSRILSILSVKEA
jgi:hypothetical protein